MSNEFTENQYREIIRIAQNNYIFSGYDVIPWDSNFVLWRHDIDFSINRSLSLARIESEEGVFSTFFVNLKSEFYNPNENFNKEMLSEINAMGHQIGLHIDLSSEDHPTEGFLLANLEKESKWLSDLLQVEIFAFSFHNPNSQLLKHDQETYCGLINCYSKKLREKVEYCSDSNGYWRFEKVIDVLQSGVHDRLQVLTHPGWWQKKKMSPRSRVHRSAYGRARDVMSNYDRTLVRLKRKNLFGNAEVLRDLKFKDQKERELCDYLWNIEDFEILYLKLWQVMERKNMQICYLHFKRNWSISQDEIDSFFVSSGSKGSWTMFDELLKDGWQKASGMEWFVMENLINTFDALINSRISEMTKDLEKGCVKLCTVIKNLENQEDGLLEKFAMYGRDESFEKNLSSDSNREISEQSKKVGDQANFSTHELWLNFCMRFLKKKDTKKKSSLENDQ